MDALIICYSFELYMVSLFKGTRLQQNMSGRGRGSRSRGSRGRGRGRGRGKSNAAASSGGNSMTTRSAKRPAESDEEFPLPENGRRRQDDEDSEFDNVVDSEVMFNIPNTLLEDKIGAVMERMVPNIVTKAVEAAVKSLQPHASTPESEVRPTALDNAVTNQVSIVAGNENVAKVTNVDNLTNVTNDPPLDLHLKDEMLAKIAGYKYVKFGELLVC